MVNLIHTLEFDHSSDDSIVACGLANISHEKGEIILPILKDIFKNKLVSQSVEFIEKKVREDDGVYLRRICFALVDLIGFVTSAGMIAPPEDMESIGFN